MTCGDGWADNMARNIPFADAADFHVALAYDGVHFTAQGHRTFAAGLLAALCPER